MYASQKESLVNEPLECLSGVSWTKWHANKLEQPKRRSHSNFVDINRDLVKRMDEEKMQGRREV